MKRALDWRIILFFATVAMNFNAVEFARVRLET